MSTHKHNHEKGRTDGLRRHYQQWKHCWLGGVYIALAILVILNNETAPYGGHFQQIDLGGSSSSSVSSTDPVRKTILSESSIAISSLPNTITPIVKPQLTAVTELSEKPETTQLQSAISSASSQETVVPASSIPSTKSSQSSSAVVVQSDSSSSAAPAVSSSEVVHSAAPASTQSSSSVAVTDNFPAFGNAVHPVQQVPNWGAMTTPTEWDRRYSELTDRDFVAIPRYDMGVLTTPMNDLIKDRSANIAKITAKLYYSTRHFGQYNLDAGDYSGAHAGIDLKLAAGTPVGSVAGGRVHQVGTDPSLGNYVTIEHHHPTAGIFFSIYGHLESSWVTAGQDVTPGQAIGTIGMTGQTTAPHLHLQIDRDDGSRPHQRYTAAAGTNNRGNQASVHPIEFISQY